MKPPCVFHRQAVDKGVSQVLDSEPWEPLKNTKVLLRAGQTEWLQLKAGA